MKLAVFAAVFATGFAAAADVQTVTIGADGPPDGNPACSSLLTAMLHSQDPKCCITSLVCQCYDVFVLTLVVHYLGAFYSPNSDNKCDPAVGGQVAARYVFPKLFGVDPLIYMHL
ncbi:hypothetical protein PG985_009345 [Apiospora marii]|uniref:uncharacterized protein n=1 Tax=Apiospora marii TaxID=335849 RepID=UPI0031326A42